MSGMEQAAAEKAGGNPAAIMACDLACAHVRSGDAVILAAYLGTPVET